MSIACRREEDFDKEQKEQGWGYADFRELYKGEVPRIHLPRTWVNKGMEKGRGLEQPRPAVTSPVG